MIRPLRPDIAITGALGNLGWKCFTGFTQDEEIGEVVGLDRAEPDPEQTRFLERNSAARIQPCDLLDFQDRRWREVFERVDAVVHFAAVNPFPDASWLEAGQSIDINLSVTRAAARSQTVSRLVYASSNHVMGGYRLHAFGASELTPALPVLPGTQWMAGDVAMDSTPYSVAKWAGERICTQYAREDFSVVSIRIGWCQPGANRPETISATGTPKIDAGEIRKTDDTKDSERWYLDMWLSNRDMIQLVKRSIVATAGNWPSPHLVVNGVSANRATRWSLAEGRMWLDYQPEDDIYLTHNRD